VAGIVRAFWVNIRTPPAMHQAPARRQHAAIDSGQGFYDTLCGFMFTGESIRKSPGPDYRRCLDCEIELETRPDVIALYP
jgi:hypothetical protein